MVANVWVAAGAGNWSDDANWSLGHSPIAGEDPTFDGTSVNNCTADDDTPTGVLTIASGYSGTITQSSDMYITGYSQAAGTFTGKTTKYVYLYGNFQSAGTLTHYKTNLVMTKDGATLSVPQLLQALKISANVTATNLQGHGITIDSGKTLSVQNSFQYYLYNGFTNNGILKTTSGISTITFHLRGSNSGINFGNIECSIISLQLVDTSGASCTFTLLSSQVITPALTISSAHATYTCTLDLAGYDLTCTSLTVGTRGILQCGEGTITTASLDSSTGAITEETAKWIFNGTGNLKLAAGQKLYDVITRAKANVTMLSDVEVSNELIRCADNIREGAFALTMDCPDKLFDRHRIRHKVEHQRYFEPEPGDLIYSLPKRREAVTSE